MFFTFLNSTNGTKRATHHLWFSGVLRGYEIGKLVRNRLIEFVCNAKRFAVAFLFLLVFLFVGCFGQTGKFSNFSPIAAWSACDQNWSYEYDMPCAFKPCPLEINSNGGLKRGHVESCSSTTKNIKSPLPQCLWPSNLAGWWLTMRGSHS